jgi:hypothetical protein
MAGPGRAGNRRRQAPPGLLPARPPADLSSAPDSAPQEERNSHHVRPPRRTPAADDQESIDRNRRFTIGTAAVIPALLIGVLGSTHSGAPHDSGLAACAYPLSTQDVPATDYPKIRAQFAGSRWPDLRTAGTAYVDLAVALRTARGTDGYQTVWFYQRLSAACAQHSQ